jgi:hypothetical protein
MPMQEAEPAGQLRQASNRTNVCQWAAICGRFVKNSLMEPIEPIEPMEHLAGSGESGRMKIKNEKFKIKNWEPAAAGKPMGTLNPEPRSAFAQFRRDKTLSFERRVGRAVGGCGGRINHTQSHRITPDHSKKNATFRLRRTSGMAEGCGSFSSGAGAGPSTCFPIPPGRLPGGTARLAVPPKAGLSGGALGNAGGTQALLSGRRLASSDFGGLSRVAGPLAVPPKGREGWIGGPKSCRIAPNRGSNLPWLLGWGRLDWRPHAADSR